MEVFIEHREKRNLRKYELPNKEQYHLDLSNIEGSWTGRTDAQIANTFIQESVQLIVNAISVYELGYFDCAYYSLRQSIELSTSIVYLMELEETRREQELSQWKRQSTFPMFNQMIKFLNKNKNIFAEISSHMKSYFDELQVVKETLNKHVHKVGFNTFYVSRNHPFSMNQDKTRYHEGFIYLLEKCIGAVAVLRLAIDPFPVLLMDEEIYSRTGDFLTEPYSDKFIEKYIGSSNLTAFKSTTYYASLYQSIMSVPKMLPSVIDVVKYQHVDREMIDEIISQPEFLRYFDRIAIITFQLSVKISLIYTNDGLIPYTSNIKSNKNGFGFDTRTFKEIKLSNICYNVKSEEAFLSYVDANGEDLFLEHNETFSEDEYNHIVNMLTASLKVQEEIKETKV